MTHRVFVYGTLLRGLRNHYLLDGASFVRADVTVDRFTLLDFGRYPAVVPRPRDPIHGEVYDVDDDVLVALDALEDYPRWYDRVQVQLAGGGAAWMYVFNHPPEAEGRPYTVVDGGSWMRELTSAGRLEEQLPGGLWTRHLAGRSEADGD